MRVSHGLGLGVDAAADHKSTLAVMSTNKRKSKKKSANQSGDGKKISLFVKTLVGKTITVTLKQSDSVLALKQAVNDAEGIPVENQRLTFAGKQLEDDRKLSDYGLKNESTLHIIIRVRNGGGDGPDGPDSPAAVAEKAGAKKRKSTKNKKNSKSGSAAADDDRATPGWTEGKLHVVYDGMHNRCQIFASSSEKVGELKRRIQELQPRWSPDGKGIPVHLQVLTFNGQELDDEKTWADYPQIYVGTDKHPWAQTMVYVKRRPKTEAELEQERAELEQERVQLEQQQALLVARNMPKVIATIVVSGLGLILLALAAAFSLRTLDMSGGFITFIVFASCCLCVIGGAIRRTTLTKDELNTASCGGMVFAVSLFLIGLALFLSSILVTQPTDVEAVQAIIATSIVLYFCCCCCAFGTVEAGPISKQPIINF